MFVILIIGMPRNLFLCLQTFIFKQVLLTFASDGKEIVIMVVNCAEFKGVKIVLEGIRVWPSHLCCYSESSISWVYKMHELMLINECVCSS